MELDLTYQERAAWSLQQRMTRSPGLDHMEVAFLRLPDDLFPNAERLHVGDAATDDAALSEDAAGAASARPEAANDKKQV